MKNGIQLIERIDLKQIKMSTNQIFEQKFHFLKQLINSYQGIKSVVDFDEYTSFFCVSIYSRRNFKIYPT